VEGEGPDPLGVGEERGSARPGELIAQELGVAEDAVQGRPQLVGQPDGEPGLVGGDLPGDLAGTARPVRRRRLGPPARDRRGGAKAP